MKAAKAVAAAVLVALATGVQAAMSDGTVTGEEWMTIVISTVVAGYTVWRVPNTPARP